MIVSMKLSNHLDFNRLNGRGGIFMPGVMNGSNTSLESLTTVDSWEQDIGYSASSPKSPEGSPPPTP